MSGIAQVLLREGFHITGSDLQPNRETDRLCTLGAKVFIGHSEDNIKDADVLVYSSAINPENVELKKAEALHIPIIPRATMLAEIMRLRCGIAVAGAHGKTTTTSLIGTLMHKANLDPTVIIGGVVNHFGGNALVGQGQFMVAEADESDGTFLCLSPTIAVVTNIDREHLDFYQGGINEITDRFVRFLKLPPFYGLVVACIDDEQVRGLLPKLNRRVVTYGFSLDADVQARNVRSKGWQTHFDLYKHNDFVHEVRINMVGSHNVLNTLASLAVLEEVGVKSENLLKHLVEFEGVKRRFTKISGDDSFTVIDDYAHHPTEIKAVIKAAKNAFSDRKIRVLFEPHRYSRTHDLLPDFALAFHEADSLVVTDIYAASERPIPGITSSLLVKRIKEAGMSEAYYQSSHLDGAKTIAALTNPDDVVLTLGAGAITRMGPKIVEHLKEKFS